MAKRPSCPLSRSGLAGRLLEGSKTPLGGGRMVGRTCNGKGGGLNHGGRTSACGGTIRFEWQVDVAKADGSLYSARQAADPTVDGCVLLVVGRLAGRLCIRDDSLLGGIVGRPSQAVGYASG